jgi:hypothetical protein
MDLLGVVMLGQWLEQSVAAVGREQTERMIEMYDMTGNLSARLKQTMLLLVDSYGDDDKRIPNRPNVTDLSLLMELDGLLRYRNRALETAVLSLLGNSRERPGKDPIVRNLKAQEKASRSEAHEIGVTSG